VVSLTYQQGTRPVVNSHGPFLLQETTMDFELFQLTIAAAKKGDQQAITKLIVHANELRDLVDELSEGLECEILQQQVNEVMGHDIADEEE